MRFARRTLLLVILQLHVYSCSKNKETVSPIPDGEDSTTTWFPKSINDVRKLDIIPSLESLTAESAQYTSKLNFDNWLSQAILTPNLGRIIPVGQEINLISVGGGLTAGAQGGGIFREGQLAAYPNLVAKQMGMPDFTTPLFDDHHSNGTGFILGNPDKSQTFLRINNNLGTILEEKNGKPLEFSRYAGKINNYACPWLTTYEIFNSTWEEKYIGTSVNFNGVSWPPFLPYAVRFIPIDHFATSTLFHYIQTRQPYNFFILEDAAEGFISLLRLKGSRQIGLSDLIWDIQESTNLTLKAIQRFKRNGSNGVIFTVPHYKYLGISTWEMQVLSQDEVLVYEKAAEIVNKKIIEWAESNDMALVDLNNLYRSVGEGQVTIGQGIRVSANFGGNFFSSDGIYPSTLGQALIANEVIKAINIQFGSQVKPIDIKEYLTSIGFLD